MKSLILAVIYAFGKCERASDLYWDKKFRDSDGNIVYDCQGYAKPGSVKKARQTEQDYCAGQSCAEFWRSKMDMKNEQKFGVSCQLHCQMVKEPNICHDPKDGALISSPNQRYCTFKIDMNRANFEKYFQFPEPPPSSNASCLPNQHVCGYIVRGCYHKNKTHDDIRPTDSCMEHPYYCAVEHPDWMNQFDNGIPDCLALTVDNFSKYLIDLQRYANKEYDFNEFAAGVERSFICVCDYPFQSDNGKHFLSCRDNVQNVFDEIRELDQRRKCDVINSKEIHGYSYFIYNTTTGEFETNCRNRWLKESYEFCIYDQTPVNATYFIIIGSLVMVLLLAIIFITQRRRRRNRYQNPLSETGSNPTATSGYSNRPETTALIIPIEGKETLDGSVETKVIPQILTNFENRYKNEDVSLDRNIVLLGETDFTLESVLRERKITSENYLRVLIDISWWLMELHGENKSWKVFYAALEPSKIGIINRNGRLNAYIINYKMAQDIARVTTVTINDHESINYKYQPPEMINATERYEARSVLSTDVYGFACIAWKILRVISDASGEINPLEDPFDREIESLTPQHATVIDPRWHKSSVYSSMKVIFQDHTKRPAFGRINKDKYSNIIKIIKECWCVDPPLRLTSAQLYHRLIELSGLNSFDSAS